MTPELKRKVRERLQKRARTRAAEGVQPTLPLDGMCPCLCPTPPGATEWHAPTCPKFKQA